MKSIPVITLDGPSGSGKGTLSRLLAKTLQWHFLDSGLIYRGFAYKVAAAHIDVENIDKLIMLAKQCNFSFGQEQIGEMPELNINGETIPATLLATEHYGEIASRVGAIVKVRQALVEVQRQFKQAPGLIADGRDMGTQIFTEADLKLYVTASAVERAKRRYQQLKQNAINVSLEQVQNEIKMRDERDAKRAYAPMVPAKDAVLIDTTGKTIAAAKALIMSHLQAKGLIS
ncbi:MAG: (d)CMP kinase [Pseudomonadota bacterium]